MLGLRLVRTEEFELDVGVASGADWCLGLASLAGGWEWVRGFWGFLGGVGRLFASPVSGGLRLGFGVFGRFWGQGARGVHFSVAEVRSCAVRSAGGCSLGHGHLWCWRMQP